MKSLQESIVNEVRGAEYTVAFLGFNDEEGLPISASIMIAREYAKEFDKFLEKEEGNIFVHADGGSVSY